MLMLDLKENPSTKMGANRTIHILDRPEPSPTTRLNVPTKSVFVDTNQILTFQASAVSSWKGLCSFCLL